MPRVLEGVHETARLCQVTGSDRFCGYSGKFTNGNEDLVLVHSVGWLRVPKTTLPLQQIYSYWFLESCECISNENTVKRVLLFLWEGIIGSIEVGFLSVRSLNFKLWFVPIVVRVPVAEGIARPKNTLWSTCYTYKISCSNWKNRISTRKTKIKT